MKKLFYTIAISIITPSVGLAQVENPLNSDYSSLPEFLTGLIENVIIPVSIPIIVVMVIISGFKFVTAGGNQTKLDEAKKMLLYALIGALLILGAFVIQAGIQGTIDDITT